MGDAGPLLLAVLAVVVAVIGAVSLSLRVLGPHERLVIYRLGNTDQSLVRGPGRTFIIPFIDRPTRVDLREQRFGLSSLRATTADGARIGVDVSIRLRVVDPLAHVVNLISLDATLPGFVESVVGQEAPALTVADARGGRLADAVGDRVSQVFDRWGIRLEQLELSITTTS